MYLSIIYVGLHTPNHDTPYIHCTGKAKSVTGESETVAVFLGRTFAGSLIVAIFPLVKETNNIQPLLSTTDIGN